MPELYTIKTFTFSELPEDIRQEVIEAYQPSDYWDEWVIDSIKEEAAELGIENFDFQYSGFWSQGDGASFTGTLSTELLTSLLKEEVNEELSFNITVCTAQIDRKSYPHYVHENMVYARFDSGDEPVSDEDRDAILTALEAWKNELCLKWYQQLREAYDAEFEEERVAEEFEGTRFLRNGKVFDFNF